MDNIIECRLDSTCKEIYTGIWQYDYGQILRIIGADLPKAVEVQFSLKDKGGDTLTRIGATVDGTTEVKVPDGLLKNENCTQNYLIYAWIYVTDDTSGNTEYQIILHVKSRPKPEEPTEEPIPEPNIFHETVEAVNAAADRAEQAEQKAKASAEEAKKYTEGKREDIEKAVSEYMKKNPINVPKKLSDLEEDIAHRTVTDEEKKTWNSYGERISDIEKNGTGGGIDVDAELKEYMQTVKPNIKKSIINKGGTVEDTDSFLKYADRILDIPNGIYPAETLPFQTILTAQGLQDSVGIKLNWKDVQAQGYLILRKENEKPSTSNDGDIAYNGSYPSSGYTDTDVEKGKIYYYRIFCRNLKNQYQSTEDGSIASVNYVDRTGQKAIADLQVGDVIKFGRHGNSDYTWKIVDTLDKGKGYVTVAADQYPVSGPFDAQENASDNPNPASARKSNGNNRWLYSNARQFLNSDGAKNEWYEAQHAYDVKPPYANMDAFQKDFTDYEKAIIVVKTNTCIRDALDGGGSETMQDKIWLASSYAMGLEVVQPLEDDHIYEAFIDNASRAYQSNYWLRTINGTTSANSVRIVSSGGSMSNNLANYNYALRPFCLLPTSTYVQWSESDNAYYFPDDTTRNPVE